jgi:hypothetical protein
MRCMNARAAEPCPMFGQQTTWVRLPYVRRAAPSLTFGPHTSTLLAVKSGLHICSDGARRPHAGGLFVGGWFDTADRSTAVLYASIAGLSGDSSNTGLRDVDGSRGSAFSLPAGVASRSVPRLVVGVSIPARRRKITVAAFVAVVFVAAVPPVASSSSCSGAEGGKRAEARRGRGGITCVCDRSITRMAVVSV